MWLEAKIFFSIVAWVFIAIVLSQILLINILLSFLLLASIFLVFLGDLIIGYQIKHNHVDVIIDPCPSGFENCVLFDFSGNIDFFRVRKGPLGKREFIRYRKEASVINRGKYPIRFINGNHGFVGHESYDLDVDLYETEALDKLPGDDIKEIIDNLPLETIEKEEIKKDG